MWRGQGKWWHLGFARAHRRRPLVIVLIERPRAAMARPTIVLLLGGSLSPTRPSAPGRSGARDQVCRHLPARAPGPACCDHPSSTPAFESWLLFFCLFPQIWAMLSRSGRPSSATGPRPGRDLRRGRGAGRAIPPPRRRGALVSVLISFVLSAALGMFIHRIIGEAEQRAASSTSSGPPRRSWQPQNAPQGSQDERSGSRARSTTPWRRASPRSSPSLAPPARRSTATTSPRRVSASR